MTESKMVSHKVMEMIKEMCEGMIHNEAKSCHENDDKTQTYEKYCKEAKDYMGSCMSEKMEAYMASPKGMAGR
jgi:hypothetical protein